jgi:hypothetical protein
VVVGFLIFIGAYITAVNLFHVKGPEFLYHYIVLSIAGLVVLTIIQLHKNIRLKKIVEENWPQHFTVYQVSRFLYGTHRSYQAALVDLLKRGVIETTGNDYKVIENGQYDWSKETNPLLQPLMEYHSPGSIFTYQEGLGYVDRDVVLHPGFERLYRLSKKVDYQKFIIPGIILGIGAARFLQGIANDKPVGYLLFEIVAFSVITLMILQMYSYTTTVRNYATDIWEKQNENGYGNDIINNFTILGTSAIAGLAEYAILTNVFNTIGLPERKSFSDSSGCSSTSSCGGDGGGSSCGGGCGGCGGGD